MSHASEAEVRKIKRLVATNEVLAFNKPAERAMYLYHVLKKKRSAIIRAGVVNANAFKRALVAYSDNRRLGVAGRPSYLHPQTLQRLSSVIREAQDTGKAFNKSSAKDWVFSFILFS
jgi:hypothetical protein